MYQNKSILSYSLTITKAQSQSSYPKTKINDVIKTEDVICINN